MGVPVFFYFFTILDIGLTEGGGSSFTVVQQKGVLPFLITY